MQQDKKTIDPYLMGAIMKGNSNGRYDIKKIKRLELTDAAIVKTIRGKGIGKKSAYDVLTDEDYWYLDRALSYYGHNMLSYPFFVQFDPRKNAKYYDTVLLQIHSEVTDDEDYVCWADGGAANFFINSEALARRAFRNCRKITDTS